MYARRRLITTIVLALCLIVATGFGLKYLQSANTIEDTQPAPITKAAVAKTSLTDGLNKAVAYFKKHKTFRGYTYPNFYVAASTNLFIISSKTLPCQVGGIKDGKVFKYTDPTGQACSQEQIAAAQSQLDVWQPEAGVSQDLTSKLSDATAVAFYYGTHNYDANGNPSFLGLTLPEGAILVEVKTSYAVVKVQDAQGCALSKVTANGISNPTSC
jgi:hypothetical protein